jgi:hypothetical protein
MDDIKTTAPKKNHLTHLPLPLKEKIALLAGPLPLTPPLDKNTYIESQKGKNNYRPLYWSTMYPYLDALGLDINDNPAHLDLFNWITSLNPSAHESADHELLPQKLAEQSTEHQLQLYQLDRTYKILTAVIKQYKLNHALSFLGEEELSDEAEATFTPRQQHYLHLLQLLPLLDTPLPAPGLLDPDQADRNQLALLRLYLTTACVDDPATAYRTIATPLARLLLPKVPVSKSDSIKGVIAGLCIGLLNTVLGLSFFCALLAVVIYTSVSLPLAIFIHFNSSFIDIAMFVMTAYAALITIAPLFIFLAAKNPTRKKSAIGKALLAFLSLELILLIFIDALSLAIPALGSATGILSLFSFTTGITINWPLLATMVGVGAIPIIPLLGIYFKEASLSEKNSKKYQNLFLSLLLLPIAFPAYIAQVIYLGYQLGYRQLWGHHENLLSATLCGKLFFNTKAFRKFVAAEIPQATITSSANTYKKTCAAITNWPSTTYAMAGTPLAASPVTLLGNVQTGHNQRIEQRPLIPQVISGSYTTFSLSNDSEILDEKRTHEKDDADDSIAELSCSA